MAKEIHTIAVIGAGALGCQISAAALLGGYRTILEDVSDTRLAQAAASLSRLGEGFGAHLVLTQAIEDALRDADLIIEAVPEEMEMKIELFTIFDKFARPHAILASSSRALSITEMASATFCAERCIGMRFSAAADCRNSLELVCAPETSEETVAACSRVAQRMRKEVVVVREMAAQSARPPRTHRKAAAAQD